MSGLAAVLGPEARVSAQALRVEAVSSYSSFLALEPVWNRLVNASGIDHPFLEHAWVRTWWECFGADAEPRILVVREGDETVAIAPLLATTVSMFGVKARRLGFFYNSHVPRGGFIVTRRENDAYAAIWEHISRYRDWDIVQLCQLPEDSASLGAIEQFAREDGCFTGTWTSGASPFIQLEGSWQQYQAGLATKHRSNLRNRFKRLRQIGPVELEQVRRHEEVDAALAEGLKLEAAAWKKDAGTAIACDSRVSRFYSLLARRAADKGWLRLHFLRAGETRVAFDYSLEYRGRMYLLKLGYDPEFAVYSSSNLLLSMVLEDAFGRGVKKYDFLGDSADWKRCWAKDHLVHQWLFVFSPTLKGRFLHSVKFRLIRRLKAVYGGSR